MSVYLNDKNIFSLTSVGHADRFGFLLPAQNDGGERNFVCGAKILAFKNLKQHLFPKHNDPVTPDNPPLPVESEVCCFCCQHQNQNSIYSQWGGGRNLRCKSQKLRKNCLRGWIPLEVGEKWPLNIFSTMINAGIRLHSSHVLWDGQCCVHRWHITQGNAPVWSRAQQSGRYQVLHGDGVASLHW